MLTELLRLLNQGGLCAMDDVARRMGVSEALVAEMADGLATRGYLVPLSSPGSHCGDSCGGCSAAAMCGLPGTPRPRLLALTEKGRRAAVAA